MGCSGLGAFRRNRLRGLIRARVRLAKVMRVVADRLGFVRRDPGIAGLAWVRLAEIVHMVLRRLGFIRPDCGEATATRRFP